MNEILALLSLRTVFAFVSTIFSIAVVMLVLNIITVDDLVKILNLSADQADILRSALAKIQGIVNQCLDILSQLLNKLFSWAGVKVDLSKIHVDVNNVGQGVNGYNPGPAQNNPVGN